MSVEGDLKEDVLSARSKIALEAIDNINVSKVFYTIDEGRTYEYGSPVNLSGLSEGQHTITYFASDDVDNVEEKKTYSFFVDTSAPRVIDEIIGNTFIVNGKEYYSGRTKLKLVAMDNKSGVKELRYSINGGEFKLYEEPFYLTEAGSLNIEVLAMDNVNNRARTTEFSDKSNTRSYVDLSGPTLSFRTNGPSFTVKDTVYVSKETKFVLAGKDAEAGFKEIDYQVGASTLTPYSESFSVEKEGFHNITFNGYDNLDNSNTENILVMVDNSGPEVFHRFSIDVNKTKTIEGEQLKVYPPHVVLFLSSTDKYAGLDKIQYKMNDGQLLPYRSLIENFKANTKYTVSVSVTDKLGNQSVEEIKFYIE